ncbi:YqeG family HAD IIIA-type phosphatase [Collinsella sp. zg1085]|uniref:YqeG family HAD IIIA-type phosphatase n=1 Tax=Collinsella sp. zg1085 TaxID=2844380 RepID=UPI001C0CCDE3|nr:YqeG family HAD IIIA-type phosphatase [Collinsella sp. zg1085]QWT17085.1 YqeG family HAD IIIA-type phosphatase [Collinsella sp. zg1085]
MSIFAPHRYVASVEKINLHELKARGIRAILLDRDNTLVPLDCRCAPQSVVAWLHEARALGIKLYMVSNNIHRREVARSAHELDMGYICNALKPLPFALKRACKHLDVLPAEAVMIGDQLYTDVWSGNLAGAYTILVKPQAQTDMWYTHVLRIFERAALAHIPCEE